MSRGLVERMCLRAGVSLQRLVGIDGLGTPLVEIQATPALKRFMIDSGMIYPVDAGPIGDDYYVELLDNGNLVCRYQRIIGSRRVAQLQGDELQSFLGRAAEALTAAIPKERLGALASTSAVAPAAVPAVLDSQLLEQLRLLAPEGDRLLLPTVHLSRYQDIKRLALKAGGAYHRDGHFRFRAGTDVAEVLERWLRGERINEKQETQFFATPAAEADLVCAKAGPLRGKRVLEPSGGDGALADAAMRAGAADVFVIENWAPNVQILRDKGYAVIDRDFLQVDPAETGLFDAIVMNPPFSKGQDLKHLKHAMSFVEPTGSVTAILAASFEFQSSSAAKNFRDLLELAGLQPHELPSGTFRESGTNVRTKVVHFDIAELRSRLRECGRDGSEFGLRLAPQEEASEILAEAGPFVSAEKRGRERARA